MNTQNLNDATRLYEVIGKFVPDELMEDDLDYINTILENIKNGGNPEVYLDAIQLMTKISKSKLLQKEPTEVLTVFIKSLAEWHIVELVLFFRSIGYKDERPA